MGQRLVIDVIKEDEKIASIYYHWSAYSTSALYEAKTLIDSNFFENCDSIKEIQLKLIHFIESVGGCIDGGNGSKEYLAISKMFPNETFKNDGSRNDGLIAITPDGMNDIKIWAEGVLEINLDTDMIYNSVYNLVTLEEYNDWRDEEDQKKLEDIPERIDLDIDSIPFGDLEDMIERLNNVESCFRHGDTIFELIA